MLNEQINETSAHAILTQVASYFDAVDAAVRVGDTNKRYTLTTNSCTSPSAPIANGSFTNIVISPTADNMADLYNGFIYAKLKLKLKVEKAHGATANIDGGNPPSVWVGFKDAAQAIAQYQILANGTTIYNQPNAITEFYITSCADIDSVKKTDVFSRARHKDIWQKVDTVRTGVILNLAGRAAGYEFEEIFVIKIDIRRFLPIATIKFLPAFAGNLSLRVQFKPDALVCAPLTLEDILNSPRRHSGVYVEHAITNRFVPLGQPFKCIEKVTATVIPAISVPTADSIPAGVIPSQTVYTPSCINDQRITCTSFIVEECNSLIPCFGLDDYLYQQLVQRYSSEALSFPVQTMSVQQMNVTGSSGSYTATLSTTPKFVDNIFFNFINGTSNQGSCHMNPLLESWQLKMGGYGSFPDIAVSTYGAQFYEIMCNAYNVNTDVACFNDDVMKSLTAIAYNAGVVAPQLNTGYSSNDVTNFIMAIPCSTDGTYQQGQTSSTPITYQLSMKAESLGPYGAAAPQVEMCFLRDSVFAIQCRPGQTPVIVVDEADITTPQS